VENKSGITINNLTLAR